MASSRNAALLLFLFLGLCAFAVAHGGGEPDEDPAAEGLAASPDSAEENPCAAHSAGSASEALAWRIGGMFGILVASCIGFTVPFFMRHPRHKVWLFLFRAFAAGVVLATGMVHVLPEATKTLEDPCLGLPEDFPWTSVFATFAALLAFTAEYFIREALLRNTKEASALLSYGEAPLKQGGSVKAGKSGCAAFAIPGCADCHKDCIEGDCIEECAEACEECVECEDCATDCPEGCRDCESGVPVCTDCVLEADEATPAVAPVVTAGAHSRTERPARELTALATPASRPSSSREISAAAPACVAGAADCVECVSPTAKGAAGAKGAGKKAKGAAGYWGDGGGEGQKESVAAIMGYRAAALTLEAGIIFHSIFIGIALGTSQDVQFLQGLAIALCFHQGFEGISLGSSLVKARLSLLKVSLLGLAFVLTTPLGVAIGLAVGSAYNPNSAVALAVDGGFGAASAGILIYAGLVDLVHPTFEKSDPATPKGGWARGFGFLSMFLGAGFMSILALWA